MLKKVGGALLALVFFGITAVVVSDFYSAEVSQAGDNADKAQMDALRRLLKENPELVLDVLHDNSEVVLDIVQQGTSQRRVKNAMAQWEKDVAEPKNIKIDGQLMRGNVNAPVTIVAYSDFTCSYCRQAEGTIRKLMDLYKDEVRFVFKCIPAERAGGKEAALTILAAYEQDQAKAWLLYDAFFANQRRLAEEGEPYMNAAALEVGLDMKRLQADKKSRKVAAILEADLAEAKRLGVEGTPHFFVNDRAIRGAMPEEIFVAAINQAIAAGTKK